MRAETNRKRSFQYLALPNRLLSSEKIVKGEGENKILKLVSDTFYPEPTPISFKDKENIVPLDFTRQEICTLEQKNKKRLCGRFFLFRCYWVKNYAHAQRGSQNMTIHIVLQ
ncbi:hypothetical protein B5F38_08765 [Barnesiella sp. An22]|nr:hypothetical protein B5F38_08765 [Barnesiella sp. An22]